MRSPLRTLVIGYRTGVAACQRLDVRGCALVALVASVVLPQSATAQRAGGEMGVSLTILPAGMVQSAALAGARMVRDESASIASSPATTPSARALVTRPCSDRRGGGDAGHGLVLLRTAGRGGAEAQEIERRVDVGTSSPDDTPRFVRVRVEYFVVPGT